MRIDVPRLRDLLERLLRETIRVARDGAVRPVEMTAIPYFAWANRGKGEMIVWLPYENKPGSRP